jgi:hypothetical protein
MRDECGAVLRVIIAALRPLVVRLVPAVIGIFMRALRHQRGAVVLVASRRARWPIFVQIPRRIIGRLLIRRRRIRGIVRVTAVPLLA